MTTADFPRRQNIARMTEAELAIYKAAQAVERAGAHPLLTEAVTLLRTARERVADYVDHKPTIARLELGDETGG